MKTKLQSMARKNGSSATAKAARVAGLLNIPSSNPAGARQLRLKAAILARTVSYHLRQAALIGLLIAQIENRDRRVSLPDDPDA